MNIIAASPHAPRKLVLFDENHARIIIDFVKRCKEDSCEILIAQCEAGVSRSCGVVVGLESVLNDKDVRGRQELGLHNRRVSRIIKETAENG
jgi:predicted protein tyrosine phosphatase